MPQSSASLDSAKISSDLDASKSTVQKDEEPKASAKEAQDPALAQNMASIDIADHSKMTESHLWMKTVIDVIHGDIENRGRKKQYTENDAQTESSSRRTVRRSTSRSAANESPSAEKKKDSQELNRIEDFLADTSLPATPIDGKTSAAVSGRRMAAELDEFDETFESAGKSERSE